MTAGKTSTAARRPQTTPIEIVCVALLVSLVILASRIATTW